MRYYVYRQVKYTNMKTVFIVLLSMTIVGCASTQQTATKVAWPSSCGPEPQFFKSYTHDNHRRDVIYDLCERTEPGNYRTARSAAIQSFRADMQVYRNIRSMGSRR